MLNVSFLFTSGIMIYSIFLVFSSVSIILSLSNLVTGSAVLSPKNSPGIWTAFLEEVFTGSGPVFNNCFLYFLAND